MMVMAASSMSLALVPMLPMHLGAHHQRGPFTIKPAMTTSTTYRVRRWRPRR